VELRKSRPVGLKAHAAYNEKWLQALIAEDPGVLGLGDLIVKDVERRQPRAGRLDMLLSDPETLTGYEVEVQLGDQGKEVEAGQWYRQAAGANPDQRLARLGPCLAGLPVVQAERDALS
jgi:hypothetical protein